MLRAEIDGLAPERLLEGAAAAAAGCCCAPGSPSTCRRTRGVGRGGAHHGRRRGDHGPRVVPADARRRRRRGGRGRRTICCAAASTCWSASPRSASAPARRHAGPGSPGSATGRTDEPAGGRRATRRSWSCMNAGTKPGVHILCKLEGCNPGGSVKDRPGAQHDRQGRGARRPHAGQDDPGAHLGQHRHRHRHDRRGQGLRRCSSACPSA